MKRMEPLFRDEAEYEKFLKDITLTPSQRVSFPPMKEIAFLGIDAGSTTTKVALVGEDGALLYSFYSNNNGNPLGTTIRLIKDIYSRLPQSASIVYSCSTGYGEALIKAALMLDEREKWKQSPITMPCLFFDPEVDCILSILVGRI